MSKLNENDADEPYSPGGSSDDDLPLLPIKMSSGGDHVLQAAEDDLKRKMEEINRQIAAQEMEIAGLLTGEPSVTSRYFKIANGANNIYFIVIWYEFYINVKRIGKYINTVEFIANSG